MANILVLDDVADAARLIRRVLEGAGHTVSTFTEEEEALEHAKCHPVDLAILDIKLKQMSGVDVLEELKKLIPDVKAIMLTGYPTLETAQEAKRLGAADYCIKPMDNQELEDRVAAVLRQQPESAS